MCWIFFKQSLQGVGDFQCIQAVEQKWHIIGIYSAYYNQTNRTEFNHLAEDLDKTVHLMWQLRKRRRFNATYISIDVCNDFNRLPKIVESVYLDEKYHYSSWSGYHNTTFHLSTVFAIYVEVPTEMMSFLKASFYGDLDLQEIACLLTLPSVKNRLTYTQPFYITSSRTA